VNRLQCLQYVADRYGSRVYLEIGVRAGGTFLRVRVPRKIGVDPAGLGLRARLASVAEYSANFRLRFFTVTSDEFFERHAASTFSRRRIDLAFIDGKHTYEQALRDITNVLAWLSPRGVVVVHDANPATEAQAWPAESPEEAARIWADEARDGWCGDVWKAIVHLRGARPDVGLLTVADDFGLAVLNPRLRTPPVGVDVQDLTSLSFVDLDRHREQWLQLGTADDLEAWLARDPALA